MTDLVERLRYAGDHEAADEIERLRAEGAKHVDEINYLWEETDKLRDALSWCSGSPDFGDGGDAREGWLLLCEPLLTKDET